MKGGGITSDFHCADIQRQTDVHDISDFVVVVIQDLFPLPPSLDLSLSLPSHPIQLMPPSLHVRPRRVVRPLSVPSENRMKIALSAKFKYGHATPERVEREREGEGRGHLQMKTASICQNGDLNAAVKTQWPAPPPPTLLHTLRWEGIARNEMQGS